MTWAFRNLWDEAVSYERFVRESKEHCALWTGVYRTSQVPAWAVEEARGMQTRFKLVAIAEDWCGDASNTVPVVAKWAEASNGAIDFRVLRRDEHPELMDNYLTNGARAIPVVVVLTDEFEEVGWWGPRPVALQQFVKDQRAIGRSKTEYYPEVRRWYAKDKGHTTLREILAVMGGAATTAGAVQG